MTEYKNRKTIEVRHPIITRKYLSFRAQSIIIPAILNRIMISNNWNPAVRGAKTIAPIESTQLSILFDIKVINPVKKSTQKVKIVK
jgi:hypothetical protein